MSYLVKRNKRARRAMGDDNPVDWLKDLWFELTTEGGTKTETNACLAEANQQTASLDAKATDLSKNWKPSGFYSVTQVQQLVSGVADILNRGILAGQQALADAISDEWDNSIKSLVTGCQKRLASGAAYTQAAQAAQASGATVNAPGLKDYVVTCMTHASSTINAAYVAACQRPWWVGVYKAFATAFNALWALAKAIVGVAVDVGSAIVSVAAEAPTAAKYLLWGGIAVGAAYVLREMRAGRKLW